MGGALRQAARVPGVLESVRWDVRGPVAKVRIGDVPAGARVNLANVAKFRVTDVGTIRVLPPR